MMKRYMAVAALAAFPMVAQAETPNVTPGEWEFVSVTSVSGDMQIPDQTETERQCIGLRTAEPGYECRRPLLQHGMPR